MKRAVLCVVNPQNYIDQLDEYSLMIINPQTSSLRLQYLLDQSDYSLKITDTEIEYRNGNDYPNERLFWYTSGTTGDSKFCSFTQTQLDHMTQTICSTYDLTSNDRYVSIMPLWHAHGQGFFWATQKIGCEVEFISVNNIKNISKYSPTFITAIPDFLKVIANFKFDHLRFIRAASAPLPNLLYQQLQQDQHVPIIEAFGMTEALSHCFTNPLCSEQRMGTIGLPDGIEADIVDGQLYIKGPAVVNSGWYNTGDLADRDEQGYYRILGRSREQINIKGIKINPVSLENQLKVAIPNLGDCVIFGSARVKCLYTGDCDATQIDKFLATLGTHCRPSLTKQISVIPVSPSDKISRSWLDQHFT